MVYTQENGEKSGKNAEVLYRQILDCQSDKKGGKRGFLPLATKQLPFCSLLEPSANNHLSLTFYHDQTEKAKRKERERERARKNK